MVKLTYLVKTYLRARSSPVTKQKVMRRLVKLSKTNLNVGDVNGIRSHKVLCLKFTRNLITNPNLTDQYARPCIALTRAQSRNRALRAAVAHNKVIGL